MLAALLEVIIAVNLTGSMISHRPPVRAGGRVAPEAGKVTERDGLK